MDDYSASGLHAAMLAGARRAELQAVTERALAADAHRCGDDMMCRFHTETADSWTEAGTYRDLADRQ